MLSLRCSDVGDVNLYIALFLRFKTNTRARSGTLVVLSVAEVA